MVTILLATCNRHKVRELRRLLKKVPIRFLTLDQFPDIPSVREDLPTFRGNAVKKALEVSRRTILPVLAEDSGLVVGALNGAPGVRSARYAVPPGGTALGGGAAPGDGANVRKLLRAMADVPPGRRRARFVCVMALALGGKRVGCFEGVSAGSIAFQPAGRTGFGYDPVFIPRGFRRTFAQLGARTKDRCSHRTKAVGKFKAWLQTRQKSSFKSSGSLSKSPSSASGRALGTTRRF